MATLKISDLSVGDWVKYGDAPYRVYSLDESGVVKARNGNGTKPRYLEADISEFEPLPITPQILEDSGMTNDGQYAIKRIDDHLHLEYYYHEHRLRKWYCGVDEWNNHARVNDIVFQAHCRSVHQLQHALRLAGADKEIEL